MRIEASVRALTIAGLLLVALFALLAPSTASADAVVRTQAMLASTIAEIFLRDDRIDVEIEIGVRDLPSFRNLLPNEIYERLGHDPEAFAERLARFFAEDLTIIGDAERSLDGRLVNIGPGTRVRRDEITGEALPAGAEGEETIVFARLVYEMPGRPAALTIAAGRLASTASIGFLVYDRGVAVNDFRYLGPRQTLDLDWEDPWYTTFRSRTLRRAYFAPMHGFIYVEPFEVRKEIVFRPRDLQHWVDLGLAGRETIPVELQPELKRVALAFLREHHPFEIDGRSVEPALARIDFLERTLRTSRVIDPPVELDVYSAMMGAIFVYPTDGLPARVTMVWDLFNERIQEIPAATVDQAGPLPIYLDPDFALLDWQNFLKKPEIPTLRDLAPPPGPLLRWLPAMGWGTLVVGLLLLGSAARARHRGRIAAPLVAGALVVTLAAGLLWRGREASLSDVRTREIVSGLLHNTYRAFDFRDEERIYDVLALSAHGDLLTDIYLETRRGLELANQGGARAKVKTVELTALSAEPADDGFTAAATWDVAGSVGHWGHVHTRQNRYKATLRVAPIDDAWKLTVLEILEEERL